MPDDKYIYTSSKIGTYLYGMGIENSLEEFLMSEADNFDYWGSYTSDEDKYKKELKRLISYLKEYISKNEKQWNF